MQKQMSAKWQKRTHAPQQKSRRASPVVSFVYLSAECLFNKFYGNRLPPQVRYETARSLLSSPVAGLPTSQQLETSLLGRFPACPLLQCHDRFSPWRHRLFIWKINLSSRMGSSGWSHSYPPPRGAWPSTGHIVF